MYLAEYIENNLTCAAFSVEECKEYTYSHCVLALSPNFLGWQLSLVLQPWFCRGKLAYVCFMRFHDKVVESKRFRLSLVIWHESICSKFCAIKFVFLNSIAHVCTLGAKYWLFDCIISRIKGRRLKIVLFFSLRQVSRAVHKLKVTNPRQKI